MNASHCSRRNARRGFAMLLVLISLAIATILATAYLASRDNSAMIGSNIASGASARSAALATLKAGIAVLETDTDWRNDHTEGVVFASASLAGASVDLKFMDLTTGTAPSDDTMDVEVTATARVGAIEETVIAHAYVPLADSDPDIDLSEFVVFAKDKLTVKDTSLITRWSSSPSSKLGKSLSLATASTSAGAITLSGYGVVLDGVVYRIPGASNILVSNTGPGQLQSVDLTDSIVVPAAPSSGVAQPLPVLTALWSNMSRANSATFTITNNRDIKALTLTTNAVLNIHGPVTVTVAQNMTMQTGARIQIKGDVKMVVFGKIDMDADTSIELEDGATLELYAADTIDLNSASINELDAGVVRDTDGDADYMSPTRFALYEYDTASKTWNFDDGSVVKGRIYAPNKDIRVMDSSAVYGSIVGRDVELSGGGNVYYDHALDTGNGYTVADGPVYDEDGEVKDEIRSNATSLDAVTINLIKALVRALTPADDDEPGVNDPTPRTIEVTYSIVSMSNSTENWESKATMIAAEE